MKGGKGTGTLTELLKTHSDENQAFSMLLWHFLMTEDI